MLNKQQCSFTVERHYSVGFLISVVYGIENTIVMSHLMTSDKPESNTCVWAADARVSVHMWQFRPREKLVQEHTSTKRILRRFSDLLFSCEPHWKATFREILALYTDVRLLNRVYTGLYKLYLGLCIMMFEGVRKFSNNTRDTQTTHQAIHPRVQLSYRTQCWSQRFRNISKNLNPMHTGLPINDSHKRSGLFSAIRKNHLQWCACDSFINLIIQIG